MIDTATGDLVIESVPIRIGSGFTRKDFLSSPLAQSSKVLIKNEPYCSFSVGAHEISSLALSVSLWFYGEQLEAIELTNQAKEFGSSWADWSEEKELKRKQVHDQWLVSLTGHASHSYKWGKIWSDFDAKSGGSYITIRYSWQGKP